MGATPPAAGSACAKFAGLEPGRNRDCGLGRRSQRGERHPLLVGPCGVRDEQPGIRRRWRRRSGPLSDRRRPTVWLC